MGKKWVVVAGDAKGNHLKWLLPFPGDWHVLLNYQKALMKSFADAGITDLGKLSGHRAETLTSLIKCSNFKRTHRFIVEVYQALYHFFLSVHLEKSLDAKQKDSLESLLIATIDRFAAITEDSQLPKFREFVASKLSQLPCSHNTFKAFMNDLSQKQDTVKLWYHFLEEDCLAYLALYVGIRYRNWQLRTVGLKMMAAVFEAFDRSIYQKLIPQHLMDLATMPECILKEMAKGCFSVRLSPSQIHGVAIDECHEMKINRDAKMAVLRPNDAKMVHASNYLQFRADSLNNLKKEIFPVRKTKFSHTPTKKKMPMSR